ncbi:MAG TPA: exonuclease domain-containing protein [Vulgatibacter sp.]|nr:exonuclease domain-containing protein [Vulgatibacter sp.]
MGFAAFDLETTGLNPFGHDRIVELAVVHVEDDGEITGAWETLVNPDRDLGPQSIHGIRAADVRRAPRFDRIAGDLIELFEGRVVVAHNAPFDCRFLEAEFARLGARDVSITPHALCTMRLARAALPGVNRTLAGCCAAFDIELEDAHRARADAVATARLLGAIVRSAAFRSAALIRLPPRWPDLPPTREAWFPRPERGEESGHFLDRIVVDLPGRADSEAHESYLALLDRCLLDRRLSEHEKDALVSLATELGIDRAACQRLHDDYFGHVADAAWADEVLTSEEREDLRRVAGLLGIPDDRLAAALEGPARKPARGSIDGFRLEPGDRVVLTGEMRLPRSEWHERLLASGLEPAGAVTKRVELLVAADPDSLSGKAKKARQYGIPIVDEDGLVALLESLGQGG